MITGKRAKTDKDGVLHIPMTAIEPTAMTDQVSPAPLLSIYDGLRKQVHEALVTSKHAINQNNSKELSQVIVNLEQAEFWLSKLEN